MGPGRAEAERLDREDPLAGFREEFVLPGGIYLDGNSLGPLSRSVRAAVDDALDDWGSAGVAGWSRWIDEPVAVGDLLAETVLGAGAGEVVACDSTTVNLFKLVAAALAAAPGRRTVVVAEHEFPTDRYVLEGLARDRGLEVRWAADNESVVDHVDADTAVAVVSLVDFGTAALTDLAATTARARRAGAFVVWDLSHAAGVVPVDLAGAGADLAVGCTYKYLGAGPGSPAYLYVRRDLQERLHSPIQGWFGQRDQFAMGPRYAPEPGIRRWLAGTPPILGLAAVRAAVEVVAQAGITAIRAKSERLTSLAARLVEDWLEPLGATLATPSDPARRGGHVSVRHPEAWQLTQALIRTRAVVPDHRPPDLVRFGFFPMSTRFVDVWDGLDAAREILESGEHRALEARPGRIT